MIALVQLMQKNVPWIARMARPWRRRVVAGHAFLRSQLDRARPIVAHPPSATPKRSLPKGLRQVIIWGHKNNGHTHSYIHAAYYRAFQALGYETYYFKDSDIVRLKNFNFENSLFFTEDQDQKNIPLIKSSKYILHHVKTAKYDAEGISYIQLGNYLQDCDRGASPYFPNGSVQKINDCAFWDEKNRIIYQPWGTDLLPAEIDPENISYFDPTRTSIQYIGGVYPYNQDSISQLSRAAAERGVKFITGQNIPDRKVYDLVRNSYLTVDLRGPWHLECGYLPCRVFKNLSYGKFIGVNSPNVKNIFGDYVAFEPDPYKLFSVTETAYRSMKPATMREAILFVRDKHTYVNRIENLLQLI